jgi:hypothetical protein
MWLFLPSCPAMALWTQCLCHGAAQQSCGLVVAPCISLDVSGGEHSSLRGGEACGVLQQPEVQTGGPPAPPPTRPEPPTCIPLPFDTATASRTGNLLGLVDWCVQRWKTWPLLGPDRQVRCHSSVWFISAINVVVLPMGMQSSSNALPLQDTRQPSMLLARICSPSCSRVTKVVAYVVAN